MKTAPGDRILFHDVRLAARVGVLPGESEHPQPIGVDLALWLDLSAAARSDELAQGLDYRAIAERLTRCVQAGPCGLLEHLAARILDQLFALPEPKRVRVRLTKLRSPLGAQFGTISIELDRERAQWSA